MPDQDSIAQNRTEMRRIALARWDNEGGAGLSGSQEGSTSNAPRSAVSALTDTEMVHLRVRVIALENVVIALLAQSSDRQLALVHDMAAYRSPRTGFTRHPLMIHAAAAMIQLVERARRRSRSLFAPISKRSIDTR